MATLRYILCVLILCPACSLSPRTEINKESVSSPKNISTQADSSFVFKLHFSHTEKNNKKDFLVFNFDVSNLSSRQNVIFPGEFALLTREAGGEAIVEAIAPWVKLQEFEGLIRNADPNQVIELEELKRAQLFWMTCFKSIKLSPHETKRGRIAFPMIVNLQNVIVLLKHEGREYKFYFETL